MTIPRADDIMFPLLRFAERGPFRNSDAVGPLAAEFQLTPEESAELRSAGGGTKFANAIHWASGQLGMAELFRKEAGEYHLTNRGREVLASPPAVLDRRFLAKFPEYVQKLKGKAKVLGEKDSGRDSTLDADRPDHRSEPSSSDLDINKTYKAILAAARDGRFATYGDLAAASEVEWSRARYRLPQQLGHLVKIAHARGWPLLSAIVVRQGDVETGKLEGESLAGFLAAVKMVGIKVDDPKAFYRDQQKAVFEWAKTAPDELALPHEEWAKDEAGGPRFVRYFNPVLEGIRANGGEATPEVVLAWIRQNVDVPDSEVEGLNKSGQSKFENYVHWARFNLAKAGLIDGSKRGIWKLTSEGHNTTLTHSEALKLFHDVREQFKTAVDEEKPAPEVVPEQELFADPRRSFWFVGAAWGGTVDQSQRFIADGVWDTDNDNVSDEVKRMKPGDLIAIKSSFTRKNNLPFDNHGKPVSCMRIKAIGTIAENPGDGKSVKVDWQLLKPPRDWFFYTYRVTIVEADRSDELARRLIIFAFANAKQDYDYWLKEVPHFATKYGAAATQTGGEITSEPEETEVEAAIPSYTLKQIIEEGGFVEEERLDEISSRLRAKKNLVLQGPPGTGKTWLAKRLAYVLIGTKDPKVTRDRLRIVQFHPSLAYEDFVRGFRPSAKTDSKLDLVDGIFLESHLWDP